MEVRKLSFGSKYSELPKIQKYISELNKEKSSLEEIVNSYLGAYAKKDKKRLVEINNELEHINKTYGAAFETQKAAQRKFEILNPHLFNTH